MTMGRPTKYNKDAQIQAEEYLGDWMSHGDVIPSCTRLAVILQVAESTLYYWAKMEGNEDFSRTLEEIKTAQHLVLVNKGLDSTHNSVITKLMLSKHGYAEKTEQKLSGAVAVGDIQEMTDEQLKAIIKGD